MKSEFSLAFNEITERFGLTQDTVMEALEAAMVSAYRRSVNASTAQNVEAKIDRETGEVRVYAEKEVVDSVENPQTEVALEIARKVDPLVEPGGMLLVESTPKDFGRVAAQTAKQVILQRLREAERDAQYDEFIEREGDMVHGTVHSITPQAVTVGLGRAEAILPRNQQIPGEQFRVRDRIRVYVLEVRKSSRGPVIVVSRTHPHMLRRLLEMEVPEINQGLVEIKAIAREAGKRAKVAVAALRDGVDPVGACVGLRGVRIQSIVRDLNDEKIDVIEWNADPATFIAKGLSPARVSGVFLDEGLDRGKTAMVVVPEDQLSLAIGRAGVNARLAARLTGWRIDIKSLPESAAEALNRMSTDETLAELAGAEAERVTQVEAVLAKKAEGRPVTPEEYQVLTGFVGLVQKVLEERRDVRRRNYIERLEEVRATVPPGAYETPLTDVGLSTRVLGLLGEAGYESAGQVLEQIRLDPDKILGLSGFGPKSMEELQRVLETFEYPIPAPEIFEAADVVEQIDVDAAEAAVGEGETAAVKDEAAPAVEEIAVPVDAEALEPAAVGEAEELAELPEGILAESGETQEPVQVILDVEQAFEQLAKQLEVVDEAVEVEEEEDGGLASSKKSKKKKGARHIEYDPVTGEMVVKRRRKRGEEWEDFNV
ncbi:MAG TPA: transcription termination factor NusA [Anaerolineales bacterium]|nr:transcription termination factor NusA [Anaerolineales bacterium]